MCYFVVASFSTLIAIAVCCQSSTVQPSTTRLTTHRTTHRTTRRSTTKAHTTTTHPTTTQSHSTTARSSKTTTVRTTSGHTTGHHKKKKNNDKQNCKNLNCMASTGSPCLYNLGGSGQNSWGKVQTLGNPDTGVIHDENNGQFLGTTVSGSPQQVSMSSHPVHITKPRILKFQYYEATDNFNLKACVNTITNCPFQSNLNVVPNDRAWRNGQMALPPGTHKVFFVANQAGNRLGSAAVKNIQLYTASNPSVPACPNMAG